MECPRGSTLNAFDFIKEIETVYDVASLKIKHMEIWPFLRNAYYFAYRNKYDFYLDRKKGFDLVKISNVLKNVFYGFGNFFKKYDYIVFSNIGEKRLMNGKYVNKLVFFLISELGKEKVLLIENPAGRVHYDLKSVSTNNVVSSNFFLLLSYIPFLRKKYDVKNETILNDINVTYNLNVDFNVIISRFVFYVFLFKVIFRIYKPKRIFITQYYSLFHQAAIYSFNKLGIDTIEFQHGVINDQHPAYNVFKKLDKLFFPKYVFVFGDLIKSFFSKNNYFIDYDHVISVGNMYLDYINFDYVKSEETIELFNSYRKRYKKIVVVSTQLTIENKLIKFLKKLASLDESILYMFVPRDVNKNYVDNNFQSNIIIIKNLNVYQIIKESDFHATVFSTCALEAPALGVPNILINIDGLAKKYYVDILTNSDITRFVDTEEDFLTTVLTWNTKNMREIMDMHNNFYEQNHKESLKKALNLIYKISIERMEKASS